MRRIKDLKGKRAKCEIFSNKRFTKMRKRMEYDVRNGDQMTLDGFK